MSDEIKPVLPQSEYVLAFPDQPYDPGFTTIETGYSEGDMQTYAAECVAAERERCAQLCEQWDATHPRLLAAVIRAAGREA